MAFNYTNLRNANEIGPRFTKVRERAPLGSPTYSVDKRTMRAVREYYVQMDRDNVNVPAMMGDFLGYSTFRPLGTGNVSSYISRKPPYEHPNFPGQLYADSVQKAEGDVPVGKDTFGTAYHDETKVSVNFSSLTYDVRPDNGFPVTTTDPPVPDESTLLRYVTIHAETRHRMERMPSGGGGLSFADGTAMAGGAAINFAEGDVSITWHQIPINGVPWNAILNCVGKTNSNLDFLASTYMGPVFQPTAGLTTPSFLCVAPKMSDAYMMPNGVRAVDMTYRFIFFPFGTNKFYRWDKGYFEQANYADFTQFYKLANFRSLFWGR